MSKIPKWAAMIEKFTGRMSGAKSGEIACGHALATEAFGKNAKRLNSGLTAFAYLFRRFGPSPWGSDGHKDLCCYYLATPMKGVALFVAPSASSASHAFGYMVDRDIEQRTRKPYWIWEEKFWNWYRKQAGVADKPSNKYTDAEREAYQAARYGENSLVREAEKLIGKFPLFAATYKVGGWKKGTPIVQRINRALLAAMKELLRPVRVRDVAINLFGVCEYGDTEADPSSLAGYGVPIGHMRRSMENDAKKRLA